MMITTVIMITLLEVVMIVIIIIIIIVNYIYIASFHRYTCSRRFTLDIKILFLKIIHF